MDSAAAISASAPAKIILLGEHAVVYGQPAIALPLSQRRATALVQPGSAGTGVVLHAADLGRQYLLDAAPAEDPLAVTVRNVLRRLGLDDEPDIRVSVTSTIPVAGGLGSGAAVATAVVRALAGYVGVPLSAQEVSDLVYETEKIHHGTPSGLDNTVIAFERPVWFRRGTPAEPFAMKGSFRLLIADTGVATPTRVTVGDVRARWTADPQRYDGVFAQIGSIVAAGRVALEQGDAPALGALMNGNQELLRQLEVSAPVNERLIAAALGAGALGAKLSGGGCGGNVIALVNADSADFVERRVARAGAKSVFLTVLGEA